MSETRICALCGRAFVLLPGPALAECASHAGAEVVLTLTACHV